MSEWREIEINEIVASANTGLDAIKRAPIVENNTGIRCMRIQDVSQNKAYANWGFTKVEEKNYEKFQLKRNDIIIARTGATVGVNSFIYSDLRSVFNNGLIRIRTNSNACVSKFLYYHFQTGNFRSFIESISGGTSSQPNIQINVLLSYDISLPPLPEQKAIAEVLSSLDDKIDLLNRQNKTLEQMAQTLFRQWFVEEAREDWEEVKIRDFVKTNTNSANKNYSHQIIKYLDTGSLTEGKVEALQEFDFHEAPSRAKRLVQHNDVLLSTVRPNQKHYGIVKNPVENLVVSTGFCVITCEDIDPHFIYILLTTSDMTEYLHSIAEGSTSAYPSLKPKDIEAIEFQLPPDELLQEFAEYCKNAWDKINKNQAQIRTLESLRDTLLPKLMSGEIRVKL